MTEAIVLWAFMLLVQQQGMIVSGGQTQTACEEALASALADAKAMNQRVLGVSECQQVTIKPVK